MKWDCDKRKREKVRKLTERLTKLCEWHNVFAWLPVKVADNDCRWLETVQEKVVSNLTIESIVDLKINRGVPLYYSCAYSIYRPLPKGEDDEYSAPMA
jgi:hypothetical protein